MDVFCAKIGLLVTPWPLQVNSMRSIPWRVQHMDVLNFPKCIQITLALSPSTAECKYNSLWTGAPGAPVDPGGNQWGGCACGTLRWLGFVLVGLCRLWHLDTVISYTLNLARPSFPKSGSCILWQSRAMLEAKKVGEELRTLKATIWNGDCTFKRAQWVHIRKQ